ncbi:MAG: Mur ligase [bacterium]|nr:MAG: Mur ligase [bacterium]
MNLAALIAAICWTLFSLVVVRRFAHVLQLEHYHNDGYLKWFFIGGGWRAYSRSIRTYIIHGFVFAAIAGILFSIGSPNAEFILLSLFAILWVAEHYRPKVRVKKVFVFTPRIKRLFAILFIVEASIVITSAAAFADERGVVIALVLLAYNQWFMLACANLMAQPVEKAIQSFFKKKARAKLSGKLVIAITGSYGKTGAKEAAAHVLERSYPLLKTPGSYNTPMGLCSVINERMEPHHEVFITEMGATRRGDIKELCDLCRPGIGIITSTGQAHLETFGTTENVALTKFELAESLPDDSVLIINGDYEAARRLAGRYLKPGRKLITYGFEERSDYMPKNIRCGKNGSTFDLKTPDSVMENISIRLLGKLNVINVTAAIALGRHLKISDDKIKAALATLPQMEHRLQLLENTGSRLVIDDGFNSNPQGAAAALETLGFFEGYRKIMVTPGIVDLGAKHEEANFNFGKTAARFCDLVILIGERRTKPIRDGLLQGGFAQDRIKTFQSLAEAKPHINRAADEKSIVLFENDLPDHMEAAF